MSTIAGLLDDGGILDPDGAEDYLRRWKGRIDQMAATTQTMSSRLGELRTTATDGDGYVEVTIDATGVLTDVRFTDRISRVAPDAVARALMRALNTAQVHAAEQSRTIVTQTMGADSVAGRAIADKIEQQLADRHERPRPGTVR